MNTLTLSMALLMGLTGSLHCAGMCGPIMWVMPFGALTGVKKWLGLALYHFGRISVYAVLGLVLHSFKSAFHPHWQQYVSIALGSALLLAGVVSFLPVRHLQFRLPWAGFIRSRLGGFIGHPSLPALLVSGILNGLLPCGLVYMALSASVIAATPADSAMLMYVFGLGTIPMLLTITLLRGRAAFIRRYSFRKLVPVVMFVFGCLFIVRGMNLGIPYLSPHVTIEHNEVKASCCHKK